MDLQTFINFILPTVCGILGWFCRELWTAVQELKEDVVRSWAENGLILLKSEDAITNIQNELEKEIDKKLLLPPETSLPWQSNNN